jgi:hypothetical protein
MTERNKMEATLVELSEAEHEELAGRQMIVGRAVQNVQLAMRAKGKPLGSVSAKTILEMAQSGEIEDSPAVQTLRKLVSG